MQHVTNQNRAQRPFCFLTNQTEVQILDYGQTTGKVNVSGVLFSPSLVKKKKRKARLIAGYCGGGSFYAERLAADQAGSTCPSGAFL